MVHVTQILIATILPLFCCFFTSSADLPDTQFRISIIPHLTEAEWATKQQADQAIRHVLCQFENG